MALQCDRVVFFREVVPPSVVYYLTDKLIDRFMLYNFSPNAQALTHKHPIETHGGGGGGRSKKINVNLL